MMHREQLANGRQRFRDACEARNLHHRCDVVAIGWLLLVLAAPAASAAEIGESYLPLVPGNTWTYSITIGAPPEVQTVGQKIDVRGRPAYPILHTVDATPIEEDYWSTLEGDVFYHGYYRPIEDIGILCDPPVKLIEVPILPGESWSTTTELFLLPDSISLGSATFTFASPGTEIVDVPAGVFTAVLIEPIAVDPAASGILSFPRRWVVPGIGWVRIENGGERDLMSYSVVMPVLPTSWGMVKWRAAAPGMPR
jgi:hypothetical protein